MNRRKIKILVDSLLQQYGLNSIPIDVEKFAKLAGAEIKREDFNDVLSGFAFQKLGSKYIGINATEGPERQRFTIAHELGHLFLHKQSPVNYDQGVMMLRDSHASEGTDIKEIEANRFAAELLMPEDRLQADIAKKGQIDLINDTDEAQLLISELADKYQVSRQAMSIRLATLYFS